MPSLGAWLGLLLHNSQARKYQQLYQPERTSFARLRSAFCLCRWGIFNTLHNTQEPGKERYEHDTTPACRGREVLVRDTPASRNVSCRSRQNRQESGASIKKSMDSGSSPGGGSPSARGGRVGRAAAHHAGPGPIDVARRVVATASSVPPPKSSLGADRLLPLMVRRMEELPEKMAGEELADVRRSPDAVVRGEVGSGGCCCCIPPPPKLALLSLLLLLSRSKGFTRVPPPPPDTDPLLEPRAEGEPPPGLLPLSILFLVGAPLSWRFCLERQLTFRLAGGVYDQILLSLDKPGLYSCSYLSFPGSCVLCNVLKNTTPAQTGSRAKPGKRSALRLL